MYGQLRRPDFAGILDSFRTGVDRGCGDHVLAFAGTVQGLGAGGSGKRIPFENSGHKHVVGSVGLSHLPDDPDSGDSQFYILLGPAGFLDGNYTVFGQVDQEGMSLLKTLQLGDKIMSAKIEKG